MSQIPASGAIDEGDVRWMRRALELARQAADLGEVPVGAVLVRDGVCLGEAYNQPIGTCDPTAHAEMLALRHGASRAANYRLPGTTLYVTIEPCTMCIGAIIHARVARLVFAAREPRAGAVTSHLQLLDQGHYNHRVSWCEGVLAEESAGLLREFFRARR